MLKQTLTEAVQAGAAELQRFFNGTFKITNKEGINNP
jgi:myo-inositol-1(or 4)-monophosphatase